MWLHSASESSLYPPKYGDLLSLSIGPLTYPKIYLVPQRFVHVAKSEQKQEDLKTQYEISSFILSQDYLLMKIANRIKNVPGMNQLIDTTLEYCLSTVSNHRILMAGNRYTCVYALVVCLQILSSWQGEELGKSKFMKDPRLKNILLVCGFAPWPSSLTPHRNILSYTYMPMFNLSRAMRLVRFQNCCPSVRARRARV